MAQTRPSAMQRTHILQIMMWSPFVYIKDVKREAVNWKSMQSPAAVACCILFPAWHTSLFTFKLLTYSWFFLSTFAMRLRWDPQKPLNHFSPFFSSVSLKKGHTVCRVIIMRDLVDTESANPKREAGARICLLAWFSYQGVNDSISRPCLKEDTTWNSLYEQC